MPFILCIVLKSTEMLAGYLYASVWLDNTWELQGKFGVDLLKNGHMQIC